MHHDENAEVYLNGTLIAETKKYIPRAYYLLRLDDVRRAGMKTGDNVLAVHCHQTVGGQYIDAGLVELVDNPDQVAEIPWISLFDGKTLGQWKPSAFGGQGDVEVADGEIVLSFGSEMTGITWSGAAPKMNYELEHRGPANRRDRLLLWTDVPSRRSSVQLHRWRLGGGVVGLSSLDGKDAARNNTTKYMAFQKALVRDPHPCHRRQDRSLDRQREDGRRRHDRQEDFDSARGRSLAPLGISSYATTAGLRNLRWRPLAEAAKKDNAAKP